METIEDIKAEGQDLPFEVQVLFRSDELLVRRVARGTGSFCYVTFDSYTDNRSLDRAGFGEHYLQSRGIDAIHILSRDNYWYQHPELPDALAAAASAAGCYSRVFAYGSSMGGYAALQYGADCGAHCGIAISPQFSIDPDVAPFEDRWLFDASRIRFRADQTTPLAEQYIFFDQYDARDNAHFKLFSERSLTIGIRVPYAGHPVGGYLAETGMFDTFFSKLHGDGLDARLLERELRSRRHLSGQYFFALSRRIPLHRPWQRIAMARRAMQISPDNAIYVSNVAWQLDAVGEFGEAAVLHQRAMELAPENLHILHLWAHHLDKTGEVLKALAVAEDLVRTFPDVFAFRNTRRRLQRMMRRKLWYGKLLQILHLEDAFDFGREMIREGLVLPNARFRQLMIAKGQESRSRRA